LTKLIAVRTNAIANASRRVEADPGSIGGMLARCPSTIARARALG
jgi:hypothetical protein